MRTATFLISLLLLASFTVAVDRSKFKRCDQSTFCKRQRDLVTVGNSNEPYTISDVHISSHKIVTKVNHPTLKSSLGLEVTCLNDGTVRLRIKENNPNRFQGVENDVLVASLQSLQVQCTQVSDDSKSFTFKVGDSDIIGKIQKSPFSLELSQNGEAIYGINGRGLFSFEFLRTKEEDTLPAEIPQPDALKPENWDETEDGAWEKPMVANPAIEGRWAENFQSHADSKPKGPESIAMDFTFYGTKHVYGIPEHASSFALTSTIQGKEVKTDPYRLYNLDVFEYELNNPMALYGSVPFMLSHSAKRTTGLFWLNPSETWIDVDIQTGGDGLFGYGKTKENVQTHWMSESGNIDVFFFFGPKPQDVFRQYTRLTGTTPVPPLFSIAYHQCKWNYRDQAEVSEVDSGFDTHNIPYDVIWLDIEHTDGKRYFTWDGANFPTPTEMLHSIAAKGRKMVTIVDPHIKRDTGYNVHQLAQEQGLYVRNKDGNEYEGHCWPGSSSWIDYVDPGARAWWAERFSYSNYHGSTPALFTWNDMNEPSVFNGPEVTMHKDALHYGGVEHRNIHNIYGMYMHQATSQGLINRNKDHNERPFVLSRAFFAGTQRFGAIWTGDNTAQWDHLAISQPMLLSLGITGITFSGADVGGFFGNPDAELLTRWYQVGAFHPFFRAHAHIDAKRREPWLVGEPYMGHIRNAIVNRYILLPYYYTAYYTHFVSGEPVLRPLWAEFPADEKVFAEQNSFLAGRDLLVAPVTAAGQTSTTVYLPGTQTWYDYWTGTKHNGGQDVTINTALDKIAVYQRGGSIIPKKERVRRSSTQMAVDPYTLVVALHDGQAEGDLYVDDGHSFDYTRGNFIHRHFSFKDNKLTSTAAANSHMKSSGAFDPKTVVERIVIHGIAKVPSKVLNSAGKKVDFLFEKGTLTIRKPDFPIASDWSITIQ